MAKKKKAEESDNGNKDKSTEDASESQGAGGRTKRAAAQKVKFQVNDLEDFTDNEEELAMALKVSKEKKGKKGSSKGNGRVDDADDAFEDAGEAEVFDEDETGDREMNDEDGDSDAEEKKSKKGKKAPPSTKAPRKGKTAKVAQREEDLDEETLLDVGSVAPGKSSRGKKTESKVVKETKSKKDGKGGNKKDQSFNGPPDEVILNYLKVQNRPFSVNDVFNNMHGKIGKTQVLKSLTALVSQGAVFTKMYGKQSVYVIRQDNLEKPSQAALDKMDDEIDRIKANLSVEKESWKLFSSQLQQIKITPTTDGARQFVSQLMQDNHQLRTRLERIEADGARGVLLPAHEKELLNKKYEASRQEWKKRKRMCTEILDSILEGLMNANSESGSNAKKKPCDYLEEMGIETDEQVGVDIRVDPLAVV